MNILKQSQDLFGSVSACNTSTEGIKYAGSKLKLLPYILKLASRVDVSTVFDPFSGTTRVVQAFAQDGYAVTSSDVSIWSETFGKCYLLGQDTDVYRSLINHLNHVQPKDGWFSEHYGGCRNGRRDVKRPWQYHNARKLDGIRSEIDILGLDDIEKAVALTSLIQALDRVDSTMGHFSSYLKDWSSRSYHDLHLRVPNIIGHADIVGHDVLRGDVFDVAGDVEADLAYLDPPYGSNNEKMPPSRVRYAAYYHIWTTVILNDEPEVFGAANRRVDSRDKVAASIFEEFRKNENGRFVAVDAIERLLKGIRAKFIILSYSSGGRATLKDLWEAISNIGKVLAIEEIDYKRNVMSGMRWTHEWTPEVETKNMEYLFLIEK